MAEVKWIKITTDIFDDEKVLLIVTHHILQGHLESLFLPKEDTLSKSLLLSFSNHRYLMYTFFSIRTPRSCDFIWSLHTFSFFAFICPPLY